MNGESPLDPRPLELPTLPGRNVRLRAFTPEDAGAVQEASQDDLIPLITSAPGTADHADAIAFLERQHDRLVTRAGYSFAIADAASDEAGLLRRWQSIGGEHRDMYLYSLLPG